MNFLDFWATFSFHLAFTPALSVLHLRNFAHISGLPFFPTELVAEPRMVVGGTQGALVNHTGAVSWPAPLALWGESPNAGGLAQFAFLLERVYETHSHRCSADVAYRC